MASRMIKYNKLQYNITLKRLLLHNNLFTFADGRTYTFVIPFDINITVRDGVRTESVHKCYMKSYQEVLLIS